MTDTIDPATDSSGDELIDELHTWLEDNWDPDLTVEEWWERLGLAGWAAQASMSWCRSRPWMAMHCSTSQFRTCW